MISLGGLVKNSHIITYWRATTVLPRYNLYMFNVLCDRLTTHYMSDHGYNIYVYYYIDIIYRPVHWADNHNTINNGVYIYRDSR